MMIWSRMLSILGQSLVSLSRKCLRVKSNVLNMLLDYHSTNLQIFHYSPFPNADIESAPLFKMLVRQANK